MIDNANFQKAVEPINKSNNILVTTHTRPDGDACGSVAAMCDALAGLGKKVKALLLSEVPEWYEFLFSEKPAILGQDVTSQQLDDGQFGNFDLIMIVDTNSLSQLPKFEDYLKRQTGTPVLVIDHHATSDGLGDIELVDTEAAATGMIIFELLKSADWEVTEKMAEVLFVAVATDTGWFRFGNTDSRVYRTAGELVESGADCAKIYHKLYENFSPQRFKLMSAMLNTLELHFGGRYATQQLLRKDFERTGAAYKDTENLVDECRRIGSIEAAALFVELKDGRVRCSLRSMGKVDVRTIAQKFGGGGHPAAAGTYLSGPVTNAMELIKTEIGKQLK